MDALHVNNFICKARLTHKTRPDITLGGQCRNDMVEKSSLVLLVRAPSRTTSANVRAVHLQITPSCLPRSLALTTRSMALPWAEYHLQVVKPKEKEHTPR